MLRLPDSPVGRVAGWVIACLGRDDLDPNDVRARFSQPFLDAVPVERILPVFASLADELPIEVTAVDGADTELQVGLNGTLVLQVAVEPAEPYLINGLLLRPAGPTVHEVLGSAEPSTDVDALVAEHLGTYAAELPGAQIGVAVAVRARGTDHHITFGAARDDSIFEIGSITKPITATVLAHMVAARTVGLGDDVSDYGVHTQAPITLEQLATHTSGLPRLPVGYAPDDDGDPYGNFSNDDLFDGIGATQVGQRTAAYSNLGYALLGQILARAGGTSYRALAERHVFEPLGMTDARVGLDPELADRLMTPHARGEATTHWTMTAMEPAGAVTATARDVLAFARAHAEAPADSPLPTTHVRRAPMGGSTHVGLAWIIEDTPFGDVIWHNGGTGGFRTFAGFHRASGTVVVALANTSDGDGPDAAAAAVLGALARA